VFIRGIEYSIFVGVELMLLLLLSWNLDYFNLKAGNIILIVLLIL